MTKTAKMELLRVFVSECLSAAAQEIFRMVERVLTEYEEDLSCSHTHHRLLDAAKIHSEDSFQMSVIDVKLPSGQQQPTARVNINVCREPENSISEPTEGCPNMSKSYPESSPASENDQSDQEIMADIEDDDMKPDSDLNMTWKKPFKCPVCMSRFSFKKTMVRHLKKHPEDELYQCQFCDHNFCHKSEFILHTRTHKAAKAFKCQDYDNSLEQRNILHVQRYKHTEDRLLLCSSEKLDAEIQLRSAIAATESEEEQDSRQDESVMKIFPLTVTPYAKSEFDQESLQPLRLYQIQTVADIDKDTLAADPDYTSHVKTESAGADSGISEGTTNDQLLLSVNPGEMEPKHVDIKNILSRGPSGKSTELIIQFEAGTAQKPYKCPCCTKCFSLTKTLIRHIKIHTEDKTYQCPLCGRKFCQKSDLVNHTRIHTGERPYQCQECHKCFAQKGNLVVHMKKHVGEKVHQCTECSYSFGQRSSLEHHMQTHT